MISAITGGLSCSGSARKEHIVVIVAGHLIVASEGRDDYLLGCAEVVRQARRAPGCLDFAITADLLDPTRINIFERWDSPMSVGAFRGSGPDDEQAAAIVSASVVEYDVWGERSLT
jgi:quinol monooxygenase YgiN